MKKKWIVLGVILVSFLAVGILPQYAQIRSSVVHQHRSYPAENREITGFDKNGDLTTHLPLMILKVDGQMIPGANSPSEEELFCEYAVIDREDHMNRSTDIPTQTGKMAINVRGNSSRIYQKKQYAIRMVDDVGLPINTALMGMPAETSWVLNGSFIDISQIRNYMLYNISGEIMDYAPRCRMCEVFTTDADGKLLYQGLYTLIEKPNEDVARMNLTKYDPKFQETSFTVQMNFRIDDAEIQHLNPDEIMPYSLNLEYPEVDKITVNSFRYVKNEIHRFEKALYDAAYTGNWDFAERQMDMNSFVDYYIINEFFQNYDAGVRSTYLHRDLGNKISMGPVWDFDGAFNNFVGINHSIDDLAMKESFYYFYLSQNPDFVKVCHERYTELRKTVLSEQYLMEYIEQSSAYLGSAVTRNCQRWYYGNFALYEKDVEEMKTFIAERGRWMDEHFKERTKLVG